MPTSRSNDLLELAPGSLDPDEDLHHPGRDGLALCLQIKRQPDAPAALLYSAYTPAALLVAAAVAGADAIVSKSSTAATLIEAGNQ